MKIYIAGSISDGGTLPTEERVKRREGFNQAERDLTEAGHEPINPVRRGVEGSMWLDYMRASLRDIADADGVALLPGWDASRGARIEETLSRELGLIVQPLAWWLHPASTDGSAFHMDGTPVEDAT